MTSLSILSPATLTVLGGSTSLSSLATLPPGGISVSNAAAGTITVQITAASTAAVLSASNAGGALISSNAGHALTITGTALEVNAALATFADNEPASAAHDTLTLTASELGLLPAQTDIAVNIVPNTGPAFVAPALLVTIQPDALDTLGFLNLSDPLASGLAQIGLGREETLDLTLAVASGLLFLPGYNPLSPITAAGLGTGEIILNFTADDIGALNTLLTGLAFIGPTLTGGEHLNYALRDLSGVLPQVLTYGNIFLYFMGANGAGGTIQAGSQTLIEGSATLVNNVLTGTTGVQGNLTAPNGLVLTPDAGLELPNNYLFLGGTSLDFGTINAAGLALSGALAIADGAAFSGPLLLQANAFADFSGMLTADGVEATANALAISLAQGAVLNGGGTLLVGNFSDAGLISGPGTLVAEGGETLLIAAGSVGGGAELAVAPGGVMVLGPISPLYGVFNATPLVIDPSVDLTFLGNASTSPITGAYAGTLGGAGGAFVINGPQVFSGTVTGFAPGDALIFPGISDFSPFNETSTSFSVGGFDGALNEPVTYVIAASIPAGDTIVSGLDDAGDSEISLRPAAATVTQAMVFEATSGVAQPLIGLNLELYAAATQSLRLTISAAHGVLGDGTLGPAAAITLTGASIAALNTSLASLVYTGTGIEDTLSITSTSGVLSGLASYFPLNKAFPGGVSAYSEPGFSEAQIAFFSPGFVLQYGQPLTAGELIAEGTTDFADQIIANGNSGTALVVDSSGTAMFGQDANVRLGADVTIGDFNGAGMLAIVTENFSSTGNLTIASDPASGGSVLDLLGSLGLAGALHVGAQATGLFDLGGSVSAAVLNIDPAGTLFAYGTASGSFGIVNELGSATLAGAAQLSAGSLLGSGVLDLGGTASLNVSGLLELMPGTQADIGIDNAVTAGSLWLNGGALTVAGTLDVAGSINFGAPLILAGGTVTTPDLAGSGTIAGYGVINAAALPGDNVLVAQGGELVLGGSLSGGITPTIAAGGVLDLTQPFTGSGFMFNGLDAELVLNEADPTGHGVLNFAASDAIDLVGFAPNLVTWSSSQGEILVYNSLGSQISAFGIQIAPQQPAVGIVSDGYGGSLITLGDELPCFARGTGLLTPHGYRAVETLKPGDPLITAAGVSRPVRWIGRRTLDLGPATARFARPVLILPGAFGPGLPARPLRLSPLHCVFADGVLVPVTHLVNGATIIREALTAAMTYFHVELDRHDILLAEGLPCESYFDSGNRGALYGEAGRRSPACKPFALSITTGPRLARIRRRLHKIALGAGFSLTYWPVLRAVGDGADAVPKVVRTSTRRIARFAFAQPVKDITLLSATACPADTDPDSEDRRELGICLDEPGFARLGDGFYPRDPRDVGYWMGRQARLHLQAPAQKFALSLAAVVQSWVKEEVAFLKKMPGRAAATVAASAKNV